MSYCSSNIATLPTILYQMSHIVPVLTYQFRDHLLSCQSSLFLLAINRLNKADSWSSGRLFFTECIFQGFTYAKFHICECLRWGNRGLFVTRMLLYAIVLRNRCGCLWRKYGMVQWWVSRLSRPYKLTQDQKREKREWVSSYQNVVSFIIIRRNLKKLIIKKRKKNICRMVEVTRSLVDRLCFPHDKPHALYPFTSWSHAIQNPLGFKTLFH